MDYRASAGGAAGHELTMTAMMKSALRDALGVCKPLLKCLFDATNLDIRGVQWRLNVPSMVSAIPIARNTNCGDRLLELGCLIINRVQHTTVSSFRQRGAPEWASRWPGEHYRLLAALVKEIRPRVVVEIGTFSGLGSLSLLEALPDDGHLTTFDIVQWDRIREVQCGPEREETYLKKEDFESGRLTQIVADLGDSQRAKEYGSVLRQAELIFIDGPKDGIFERKLLENFIAIGLQSGTILVFDDIRVLNMVEIWSRITHPKLDFTGFGHFTGTGLVEWR